MTQGLWSGFLVGLLLVAVLVCGIIFGWTTARDATIRQCDTIGVFMFGSHAFDCARKH